MENVALSCGAQVENWRHENIVHSTFTSTSPKPSRSIFAVVVVQFVISPNIIAVWECCSLSILMEDCYLLQNQANTMFISANNSQHTARLSSFICNQWIGSWFNLIVTSSIGWIHAASYRSPALWRYFHRHYGMERGYLDFECESRSEMSILICTVAATGDSCSLGTCHVRPSLVCEQRCFVSESP